MVSKFHRHLSLLLVVAVTMSYLTFPLQVNAQAADELLEDSIDEDLGLELGSTATLSSDTTIAATTTTTAAINSDYCPKEFKNDAAVTQNPSIFKGEQTLKTLPPYVSRCFTLTSGTLYHKFRYDIDAATQKAGTVWQLRYTKQTMKAYGGCFTSDPTCKPGESESDNKLTVFSKNQMISNIIDPIFNSSKTTSFPVSVYKPVGIDDWPEEYYLLASDTFVYGFYTIPAAAKNGDTFTFLDPNSPKGYINADPLWHYIAVVNGLGPQKPPYPINATVAASDTLDALKRSAQTIFTNVTNNSASSLTAGTGDIDLIDDPSDTTGDTNSDGKPDPKEAPIVRISGQKLFMGSENLEFKLKHDLRSRDNWKSRQNNYFVFVLHNLTATQKAVFTNAGITDPEKSVYLAIDLGGNIGILVDDKVSADGGLFAVGKDRFDIGSVNFIAVGNFDGNRVGRSRNPVGDPLVVNIAQYRDIITERVYNEPDRARAESLLNAVNPFDGAIFEDGAACGTEINYPDRNSGYKSDPFRTNFVPLGNWRKCLNIDTGGWLKVWKVTDTAIDQAKDNCTSNFNVSLFGTLVARPLCFMMNVAAAWSIGLAKYSIDFLLEAVGLQ